MPIEPSIKGLVSAISKRLPLSGGVMTGFLTLNADPVNALHAVTKQYADALIGGGPPGPFVRTSIADTITAVHTFNPAAPGAPFTLGANATGQLVTGLNADLLDGLHASAFQPIDADLTAIAALGTTGLLARTAANTWALRTLLAGSSKVSVLNGDGVAGDPTVDVVEANLTLDNIGGTLGIAKGGTGQTTALAAFNALSPLTTRGDLLTRDASNNIRLAVGAAGRFLRSDGTDPAWQLIAPSDITPQGSGSGLDADLLDGLDSTAFQPIDADLTAYAALTTTGYVVRTGAGTVATRSLTSGSPGLDIDPGDGVTGNTVFTIQGDLAQIDGVAGAGILFKTTGSIWYLGSLVAPVAGLTITSPGGDGGIPPTFALANDLAALEGLAGTGIAVRSAADTWVQRTIVGGTGITVTDGDGVAGNPSIALSGGGSVIVQLNDTTFEAVATTLDFIEPNVVIGPTLFTSGPAGEANIDMGGYVLRGARAGALNNIILSNTTNGLISGSSSTASLELESNTAGAKLFVDIRDRLRVNTILAPILANHTFIDIGPTSLAFDIGASVLRCVNFQPTITHTDTLTAAQFFRYQATHSSAAASSFTLGAFSFLLVQPTFTPGVLSTFGINTFVPVFNNPTFSNAGIGNTLGTNYSVRHSGAFNTNWTINDWALGYMVNPAGAGGAAARVGGLRVDTLTRGTFNYSVWSEGPAVPFCHGGPGVFGVAQAGVPVAPTANTTLEVGASATSSFRNATRAIFTPTANQVITLVTNTILANATFVDISNTTGGSITLTSTPTIAAGEDGMWLCILNVGTQNVVVQDQGTLPLSNLRLAAATRTIGPRDSLILRYSADIGDWVEIGFNNVI
jgi:hypothetical protein